MTDSPGPDFDLHTQRRDRAVLGGALAGVVVRLVTAAASFASLGIVARALSPAEFGLVAILVSVLAVVTMLDIGIGGALTNNVAASHGRDDMSGVRRQVDNALLALALMGAVLGVVGVASTFGLPWNEWIGDGLPAETVRRSLIITFVVSGASLPAAVGSLTLSGMQRFAAAQMSLAVGGIATVVTTASVAALNPPPEVFVLTILGSPLVASVAYTLWARFVVLRRGGRFAIDCDELVGVLRASGWYAVYSAANTVTVGTGTMVVGSVVGLAAAGVFSVALRLFSPVTTVVTASGTLLWPGMTEAITRGDVAWARSRYLRGLVVVAAASSALSLILVVFGRWVTRVWVGADLVPSLSLLAWTAAFVVAIAIASQAAIVVLAVGRIRALAALGGCAAVVSFTTAVLLARTLGAVGAMIAPVAALVLVFGPGIVKLAHETLRALDPLNER